MRELKFRAWIKDEDVPSGYMFDGADNTFVNTRNGVYAIENYEGKIIRHKSGEYTLMQYTGLKDKNGLQEVYEGDIIDKEGIIKGNIYENNKGKTDFIIQGFGTKDWVKTYNEAIFRGCKNS